MLGWIDEPDNVTVSYDIGGGHSIGRIEQCVFAAGWNDRYLVAKQYILTAKKVTNFYVFDVKKDSQYASPEKVVTGPMTESEYWAQAFEMDLPAFSEVLASPE